MDQQRVTDDENNADSEADTRAAESLRKYDQQSNYREQLGLWRWPVAVLASGLTLFQLYTGLFGTFTSLMQGAVHVGAALGLVFLLYPARKSWTGKRVTLWVDVPLAAAVLWANLHIIINYDRLTGSAVIIGYETLDYVAATLGIILLLEATRRCVGMPIVVIALLALVYFIFGPQMPIFRHAGYSWEQTISENFFTSSSIFGTPIQVSSTFIYLFLFFGVLLVQTNIGQFFNDIAFAATGRYTGGTAKGAVVASGLQGTVTGSSVANTVATGSFTIPMMKRAGFRREFAGATEASASTGGQLVPPIMGAAVFIMAEYTGVPYNEIIVLAIVPAVLYYTGVFMGVHFEARRYGILGLPRERLPAVRRLIRRFYLVLPLITIVGLLLAGRSPAYAALFGIAIAFAVSLLHRDTRMSVRDTIGILERGARVALPVICACATAGIIAGTVTKTGLGHKLAGGILDLAFGNFGLVLLFTMIACLILGMGLPTTANYVVTATVAAPILLQFDVPVIAAHLFVFYFGIAADITPPVCLAAYAGAGIAGGNPMRTGVNAVKVAIAAYIVPFIFVSAPVLLFQEGATVWNFLPVFATALLGMIAISAGIMGYFLAHPTTLERILLMVAGVALVIPVIWVSLAGFVVLAMIGVVHRRRHAVEGSGQDEGYDDTTQSAG